MKRQPKYKFGEKVMHKETRDAFTVREVRLRNRKYLYTDYDNLYENSHEIYNEDEIQGVEIEKAE